MKVYEACYSYIDWDFSNATNLNVDIPLLQTTPPVKMIQQIVYNERALFIYQRAWESCIREEVLDRLGEVCEDSCMEFFFAPVHGDNRYFNIEINPAGNVFLGFGRNRNSLVRLFPKEHFMNLEIHTAKVSGGWEAIYKIPIELIKLFFSEFELHPGVKMRGNCYKCADLGDARHYLVWNQLSDGNDDFHSPGDFGSIILK